MARVAKRLAYLVAGILAVLVAILGLFTVQRARRERLTTDEAAPRGGRFVQAADARIFVQEAGSPGGPAVLLVHGTGAWSEIWRGTMNALAGAGYRVVAIDVPPFGYSERLEGAKAFTREKQARRMVAVLDALGIAEASLVGHSVGARPTIEAAMSIPSRVRSLVLVDPALGFAEDESSPRFEQNHPSLAVRALFGARPLIRSIVGAYGTNPSRTATLFRSFVSRQEAVTAERIRMLQQPLAVRGTTAAQSDWLTYLLVAHDSGRTSDAARTAGGHPRRGTHPVHRSGGAVRHSGDLISRTMTESLSPMKDFLS